MKKIILICFVLLHFSFLNAQTNYANVKAAELSESEIREFIIKAESIGYSDAQIEQIAMAQGMPLSEVQILNSRVAKIREKDSKLNVGNTNNARRINSNYPTKQDSIGNDLNDKEHLVSLLPKIFGEELFKNSNLTFEPNLRMATPASYIIGPDDELQIDITGDNIASYELKVNTEGNINIQYAGIVSVSGLSVEAATSKIRSRLSSVYPGIASNKTKVNVNLGNIRSINIMMTGAVTKPGTYTLSSLSTIFNALYASGGPADNGTYRTIQLIRNNRVVSTIDIYDFLVNGFQKGNIRLQDQDVIHIPIYANRVEFEGLVKRPAIYEIVEGESLQDLINYAGGFGQNAYSAKVKVYQKTDKERRLIDIFSMDYSNYFPKNGDHFIVENLLDRFENRVSISGAVFRPGSYGINRSTSLSELIKNAQGVTEDAYMERGYINRLNADNTLSVINFNVGDVLSGKSEEIILKREDKITISSIFDLRDEYKVTIQGQVRNPGDFEYADNIRLENILQMSGGLTQGANANQIEIARRYYSKDSTSNDYISSKIFLVDIDPKTLKPKEEFLLKPFDIINVRSTASFTIQRQVLIEGEVKYPGYYTISREDERISDLLARAGGTTEYAFLEGASLLRPDKDKLLKEKISKDQEISTTEIDSELETDDSKNHALRLLEENNTKTSLQSSDLVGINLPKILKSPKSNIDLILNDGDVLRIPKELQTVKVLGEVLNSNKIIYKKGESLQYYINQAGGFTGSALKKKTFVQYANGSVKGTKKMIFSNIYPEIKPGAEIIVPKRSPREKMPIQGWIGMSTGLASLAAIIVSLLR